MDTEDLIKLPSSSNSGHGIENDTPCETDCEANESNSLPLNSQLTDEIDGETPGTVLNRLHDSGEAFVTTDSEKEADANSSAMPVNLEMTGSVEIVDKPTSTSHMHIENAHIAVQSEIGFSNDEKDGTFLRKKDKALSGVKRPRMTDDEQQPSVHVIYNSLPRESKQKLEELLQQWSQWHSQRCSASYVYLLLIQLNIVCLYTCVVGFLFAGFTIVYNDVTDVHLYQTQDSDVILECGEETYFPALRVGLDKPSSVTFWVDKHTKIQSSKEFIPLDGNSVPLYDRGYSLALTSTDGSSSMDGGGEELDTSRCFNCGSYSHALRECRKPRDNVAVNNARKQHKSRRNQHASSRNSSRYYQSSRGGKYDGLVPGVLDAETRQILGLREYDPPPWLHRMRDLGYPPGYLDPDIEDQPSGIMIFGDDEENKEECEEGEILDASFPEPSRKMTVEFPGINAPIPENADERLWVPLSSSSFHHSRDHSHRRYNHTSETPSRRRYTEQRWSWDLEDDGPPGCDPGTSPSLSNHIRRYGNHDSGYHSLSSQNSPSTPLSPGYNRSSFRQR